MDDFQSLFDSFSQIKVAVIGDVMLDTYMWGQVERISPEAPVPIVTLHKKEYRVGGAGNVALNCRALGASVSLFSVTGQDSEHEIITSLLEQADIDTQGLLAVSARITTNKTRVISRNQQMLRLDAEDTSDISQEQEKRLLEAITAFVNNEKPAVIIFEDYNKGVLTRTLIQSVIALSKSKGIITAVDPKKRNFFSYSGADIFKPNLKEVREALQLSEDKLSIGELSTVHKKLKEKLDHRISLITLSEQGIFYQEKNKSQIIPSHLRKIADVSGAGDTVIAVAALTYATNRNLHLMAEIANIAGGVVCESVGTAPVDRRQLLEECQLLLA